MMLEREKSEEVKFAPRRRGFSIKLGAYNIANIMCALVTELRGVTYSYTRVFNLGTSSFHLICCAWPLNLL